MENELRLVIVSRTTFLKRNEGYFSNSGDGKFLDELSRWFSTLTLASVYHEKEAEPLILASKTYRMHPIRFRIREMPDRGKRNARILYHLFLYLKDAIVLFSEIKDADAVFLFMPKYRGVLAFLFAKLFGKSTIAYLGADWSERSKSTFKWTGWRKRVFLRMYTAVAKHLEPLVMRNVDLRLGRGKTLYKRYTGDGKPLYEMVPICNFDRQCIDWERNNSLNSPIVLLYVGRLERLKGLHFLLPAVASLVDQGHPVKLRVVGGGSQRDKLKELAEELGIVNKVSFLGYIAQSAQLQKVCQEADIFVLPSLDEGLPRVLFEAMSQGVPVVATRVGGIPGAVKDNVEAVLVEPRSSEALVQGIKRVIEDSDLRARLIDRGRHRAFSELGKNPSSFAAGLIEKHICPSRPSSALSCSSQPNDLVSCKGSIKNDIRNHEDSRSSHN